MQPFKSYCNISRTPGWHLDGVNPTEVPKNKFAACFFSFFALAILVALEFHG